MSPKDDEGPLLDSSLLESEERPQEREGRETEFETGSRKGWSRTWGRRRRELTRDWGGWCRRRGVSKVISYLGIWRGNIEYSISINFRTNEIRGWRSTNYRQRGHGSDDGIVQYSRPIYKRPTYLLTDTRTCITISSVPENKNYEGHLGSESVQPTILYSEVLLKFLFTRLY